MKITKKLLCMALSIIMVMSCVSVAVFADETAADTEKEVTGATKFSDVSADEIYAQAVSTLNLMGVINGYPDGTFGPEKNVTRAEFTAMLMRTLNYGSTGSASAAELPFTDVDDNNSDINWAIPNINTAYSMGIINGYEDNTFRPSDNVAFEEAVKMIVCTLGYGDEIDVNVEPWYANYISMAAQIGLTKNANKIGMAGTPATRACIAQLLYDALEIDLVERGERTNKTILSDYLGYIKNTGVISSNDITSLTSSDDILRENEIKITAVEEGDTRESTYTYSTTDLTLKNYLGYEVEFYYKSDGTDVRTLMICVVKDTEPVTINAVDIEDAASTATQIAYYKNADDSRETKLTLENDNVVVYNGKLYGNTAGASRFDPSMLPEVGSVTLIDSDNNNKFDVVNIEKYEVYYVTDKATSTFDIIDNVLRPAGEAPLRLDTDSDRNLKIVNTSGSDMSFSSISKGNIICYARSNGAEPVTKAVVVTDKVTGSITSIKGEKITINNKEYKYSKRAPWVSGVVATEVLAEPEIQDNGTFYLDINGDIVAYDKTKSTESIYYGYILGYSLDNTSFDGEAVFRLLNNSTSSEVRIGTYEKTKVDGNPCSTGRKVVDALKASAKNQNTNGADGIQQLIKYTTKTENGKTVFNKIYTATAGAAAKVQSDALVMLDGLQIDDDIDPNTEDLMTYNSAQKTLVGGGKNIKLLNTIVFTAPLAGDRNNYDEFSKSSISTTFKDGNKYRVQLFDVDETNVAKIAVVYGASNAHDVDAESSIYVLTEAAGQGMINDGDKVPTIKGFKITESALADNSGNGSDGENFSDESYPDINDITAGDIFRTGTDKDGLPKFSSSDIFNPNSGEGLTDMIYDYDGSNTFGITTQGSRTELYEADYSGILGTVVARSESNVVVAPVAPGDLENRDTSKDITFTVDEFSDANALVYTDTDKGLEINKSEYTAALAGLRAYDGTNKPSTVYIYMANGDINLLCVFPIAK